ncbi:MAG: hypothetical protein FWE68_04590, partial [Defluviitaleaceae bacterium]|nr:hypothetical protein [Defluviitaleaceae bacterium]
DVQIQLTEKTGGNTDAVCEVFGEGIRFASEAFAALTNYFENVSRPTYIVMFGDHAPSFANNKKLYAPDENDALYPEDEINQYIAPIVIWSNTGENFGDVGTLSTVMLTEILFDIAKLPKPPYIRMLSEVKKTTTGFTYQYYLDSNGNVVENGELRRKIEEKTENLRYCQYDATFGKKYVINEFK